MPKNRLIVGNIWEAVEDEPKHFYEILDNGEVVNLRRLCDNSKTTRFMGQITNFGVVRKKKRGE